MSTQHTLCLVLLWGASACGGNAATFELDAQVPTGGADAGVSADAGDPTPACKTVPRTCDQILASFDMGIDGLLLACDESTGRFMMMSTGVPNYDSNQSTPNRILDQMWTVSFPLQPTCAATPHDVVASRGPIGFMINGVPFYGPQDAQGRDAVVFEGQSFDDCSGHADPSCSYHYHAEPVCIAAKAEPDGHAALIGYALDGFAIYGSDPRMDASELDDCHGHADATRGYHYHATSTFPYLMACYVGDRTASVMSVPACRR